MTYFTASERGEVIEAATIAGYEARARKTGSPKWGYRDPDSQRRYREIVTAAFEALEAMGVIDLSPQTQSPPPDAIRAAIANQAMTHRLGNPDMGGPARQDFALADRVMEALAQIGAVPGAVGDVPTKAILNESIKNFTQSTIDFMRTKSSAELQLLINAERDLSALIDRLPIANGAGDGA